MFDLDAVEVRVLGCLLEKQQTTPDAYPLTLNSLRLACNQATNRTPVADYDQRTVQEAVQHLGQQRLTRLTSSHGGRAPKYRHLLGEEIGLDAGEQALLGVLLLRGPQTLGELKQRSERAHSFADLEAVQEVLGRLGDRGLGRWLERQPGQKEARYEHALAEQPDDGGEQAQAVDPAPPAAGGQSADAMPDTDRADEGSQGARSYPFTHRLRVRYNECDPQNVVFNANYFTYFDITITELWRAACGSYAALLEAGADLMVVEARARYRAPARFDDELQIAVGIAHLGTTSIVMSLLVSRDGEPVTEGELRYVFIDSASQRRREPPAEIRSALERFRLDHGSLPQK